MSDLRCPYCAKSFPTFVAARAHLAVGCAEFNRRLAALGFDLECKVRSGEMKLEAAEAEQATRKTLRL